MPKIDISGSADLDNIRFQEQGSNPSTPATGYSGIFMKSDGLYVIDDSGTVTGPLVSTAGAFLGARYKTAAGQTIGNAAFAIIDYGTSDYDTDSAVTTGASWKFTVPAGEGGKYSVKACAMFTTTTAWATSESAVLGVHKNGTLVAAIARYQPVTSGVDHYVFLIGATDLSLAAADYIDIRVYQSSGGNLALHTDANYNHVSIAKIH